MPTPPPDGTGDGPAPSQDDIDTGVAWATVRRGFRRWRRSRPFWAGLWTVLGGAVIVWIPLSDTGKFLNAGQVAMTTVLPGVVLVVAGLFLWFSPANRTLAGVLALVFAVASLVISNLGGFGLGMLLGIIGGSMALGWTDEPRPPRPRRRRAASGRDSGSGLGRTAMVAVAAVAIALSLPIEHPAAADADEVDDAWAGDCLLAGLSPLASSVLGPLSILGPASCPLGLRTSDLTSVDRFVDALVGLEPDERALALHQVGAGEFLAAVTGLDLDELGPAVAAIAGEIRPDGTPLSAADLLAAVAAVDAGVGLDAVPIDEVIVWLAALLERVTDLAELIDELVRLLQGVADTVGGPTVDRDPAPDPFGPGGDTHARSSDVRTAAAGHDAGHVAPSLTSDLALATLETTNLAYAGVVTHPTAHGSVDVIRFVIDRIDATGLDLSLPDGQSAIVDLANREGAGVTGTGVVLDCAELSLRITGVRGATIPPPLSALVNVPLTLRPGSAELAVLGPALDLLPPGAVLVAEAVDIDLVTLSADEIDLVGLGGSAR